MIPRSSGIDRVVKIVSANIGTKLISVAIAIVLWAIVLGSRNVEVTKEVPLEIITPADVVAANDIPEKIAFKLSGPKAFLRTILDRREEPIRVNLAGAKPALVTYRFFSDNIRLPIGVKVLSINPTAILIKLEYFKRKDVPVRLELRGAPPDGYRLVKAEIKPEVLRVKGAESRVDSLTELSTVPVDLASFKKTTEKEVSVDLAHTNVQLDSPLPKVYVEMEPISANFKIKNVDIRILSSYKAHTEEKTVTVLVRANAGDLETLDRTQIYAAVDLSGKAKGVFFAPVKVHLPKNITLVKVIPDHVKVTLF